MNGYLALLCVVLYVSLKRILRGSVKRAQEDFGRASKASAALASESQGLKSQNHILRSTFEKTIALYEITKEICKTFDEGTIFNSFREQVDKHIHMKECLWLKGEADLARYPHHLTVPLYINKNPVGWLVADDIEESKKETFQILSQQFFLGVRRALLYQKLQELAITDALTGVFTRRHYLERLKEEIEYSSRFNYQFAVLMLDVDHFKEYNDHYGHLVGDALLREISKIIKDSLRQIDLVGRYGGEEFSIILTQTERGGAHYAAERIRQSIEEKTVCVYDEELKLTVSIGMAFFPDDARDPAALIEKADIALYEAKTSGRNKVCLYGKKSA